VLERKKGYLMDTSPHLDDSGHMEVSSVFRGGAGPPWEAGTWTARKMKRRTGRNGR
jgi:hypothetical protein